MSKVILSLVLVLILSCSVFAREITSFQRSLLKDLAEAPIAVWALDIDLYKEPLLELEKEGLITKTKKYAITKKGLGLLSEKYPNGNLLGVLNWSSERLSKELDCERDNYYRLDNPRRAKVYKLDEYFFIFDRSVLYSWTDNYGIVVKGNKYCLSPLSLDVIHSYGKELDNDVMLEADNVSYEYFDVMVSPEIIEAQNRRF